MINVSFYDAAMKTDAVVTFDNHETLRMAMQITFDLLPDAAIFEETKFRNGKVRISIKDRTRKIIQCAEFPADVMYDQKYC